jgi:Arc/MetJ-type ribon-helix-helix transcriptional regulator
VYIHVRLRKGKDDDIATWYEGQGDRSEAVREALRAYMRLHNGDTQEAAVRDVMVRELARLPEVVGSAVREALTGYQLSPTEEREIGAENPELAARLDEQLDDLFGA